MKIPRLLLFAVLAVRGIAGVQDSAPDQKNSVPKLLDVHFISTDGQEFHFYRTEAFVMKGRDCRLETVTRYEIDHAFDAEAREVALEVSEDEWITFRRAVRSMKIKEKNESAAEHSSIKTAAWRVRIIYPDTEVSFTESDSATLEQDFEPLRHALSVLTKGQWPKKMSNQAQEPTRVVRGSA